MPSRRTSILLLVTAAFLLVGESWMARRVVAEGDLLIYFPTLVQTPWDGPWDEWVGGGAPALANPQRAYFYPPAWPLRWDFFAWLPIYLTLHHALAGVGAWAWLRCRGAGWGPVLGGLVYACSGPAASLLTKLDKMPGWALAPLVLLGLEQMWRGRAWGLGLAAGSVAALWLGGSVEHLPFLLVAGLAFASFPDAGGPRASRWASVGLVLGLGLLLAGPSVVPFLELLPYTAREASETTDPLELALAPGDLLRILQFSPDASVHWLLSAYIGWVGATLAAVGLVFGQRRAPAVVLLMVTGILAMGGHTPLGALVWNLPVLGSMRFPEKWVLAGLPALAWLIDGGVRALGSERAAKVGPFAFVLLLLELTLSFRTHVTWSDQTEAFAPSPALRAIASSWDGERAPRLWDPDVHTHAGLPRAPGTSLAHDLHRIAYPNTGVWHGVGYLFGTSALRLDRHVRAVHAITALDDADAIPLLRRYGVDYWITFVPRPAPAGLAIVAPTLDVGLLRDRAGAGDVRLASLEIATDWDDLQARLARLPMDRAVALEGDAGVEALVPSSEAAVGTVVASRIASGWWQVEVDASTNAILVLTQTWAPGWAARVDGGAWSPAAVVDAMLVGTPAPAGHHTIELRYRAPGLGIGWALALGGIVAVGGILVGKTRRRG